MEKARTYQVTAKGAVNGSTILISHVSSGAILSTLGKVFGVAGVTFVLTLIFGMIGLIKYLDSKKNQTSSVSSSLLGNSIAPNKNEGPQFSSPWISDSFWPTLTSFFTLRSISTAAETI